MASLLLLLFPLTYLLSFFNSLRGILRGDYQTLLSFFVLGLPIYITSLSILHLNRLDATIPFFQYSKEVVVILALALLIYRLPVMPSWNWLDRILIVYFLYTASYIFLPLGGFSWVQKIIAFKNISFFPLVYFLGRHVSADAIWISKFQKQVMFLALMALIILAGELLFYTHFQTITGYASFYEKYFSFDPAGNYGLSWTFEIDGGVKRFASFFANPLELAASTLITASVLAIVLVDRASLSEPKFFFSSLIASAILVLFAISRASLAGYFLASYLFFLLLRRKKILFYYHAAALLMGVLLLIFATDASLTEFIVSTFNFTNSSSLSHLIEWVDGIEAIKSNPLGLGLGESGRVAGALGLNTGGENQFIILGVQCGLPAFLLYILILSATIYQAAQLIRKSSGRSAQLGTMVFIIRIGLLIPLLTAAVESYLYVSYVGWFLTGMMSTSWSALHNSQPSLLESRKAE